jgi:hypothetical protein
VETEENLVVAYEKDNGSLVALTPEPRKSTKNVIVSINIYTFSYLNIRSQVLLTDFSLAKKYCQKIALGNSQRNLSQISYVIR